MFIRKLKEMFALIITVTFTYQSDKLYLNWHGTAINQCM